VDTVYTSAMIGVTSILDQISRLNWAFILSGVGIVEGVLGNFRRRGVTKSWAWMFPLTLGLLIGATEYLAANGKDHTGIQYVAKIVQSALTYCGWVTFSYYFTLRPIKYAGDWIKRRSKGSQ
jgi:hypothetical protein